MKSYLLVLMLLVLPLILSVATPAVLASNSQNSVIHADIKDNNPSNHPSGKNRNDEKGNSYPQGNSHSNPDGGGVDKPYDSNGQSAHSQGRGDYDGNNGCGNDNDFADDNNGKCKGHQKPTPKPVPTPCPVPTPKPTYKPSLKPTYTPKPSQSPKPTTTPTPSPSNNVVQVITAAIGGSNQTSSNEPQVIGISTIKAGTELPKTGPENAILLLIPLGLGLIKFSKSVK